MISKKDNTKQDSNTNEDSKLLQALERKEAQDRLFELQRQEIRMAEAAERLKKDAERLEIEENLKRQAIEDRLKHLEVVDADKEELSNLNRCSCNMCQTKFAKYHEISNWFWCTMAFIAGVAVTLCFAWLVMWLNNRGR